MKKKWTGASKDPPLHRHNLLQADLRLWLRRHVVPVVLRSIRVEGWLRPETSLVHRRLSGRGRRGPDPLCAFYVTVYSSLHHDSLLIPEFDKNEIDVNSFRLFAQFIDMNGMQILGVKEFHLLACLCFYCQIMICSPLNPKSPTITHQKLIIKRTGIALSNLWHI